MKENQYYQEKQFYFLYMLCSEGARGLISQDGERDGKRCSSKMEQGQGDKRKQRDQGEKVSGNDPKLHWRDMLSNHPLDSQHIYDKYQQTVVFLKMN